MEEWKAFTLNGVPDINEETVYKVINETMEASWGQTCPPYLLVQYCSILEIYAYVDETKNFGRL